MGRIKGMHTKGPWVNIGRRIFREGVGSTVLAKVNALTPEVGEAFSDEAAANIRLICAAPEMLEMLADITWDEHGGMTCWPSQDRVVSLVAKVMGRL